MSETWLQTTLEWLSGLLRVFTLRYTARVVELNPSNNNTFVLMDAKQHYFSAFCFGVEQDTFVPALLYN
jgi:hypothetical protein|tara:strand:- start:367 stop:573 length:207 start_codon:yes stop_codon:yes gene_type:complete